MKFKFINTILVSLVLFVSCVSCFSRLANAAESTITSIELGPKMGSYEWNNASQLSPYGDGYVVFLAEGILGMHISFADSQSDGATMYELVVGAEPSQTYFRNVHLQYGKHLEEKCEI